MLYSKEQVANFHDQQFDFVLVDESDHVLSLTLNRPEKKNALNPLFMSEIAYCLAYAHHTPEVWIVKILANGNVWSAGADLKAFAGEEQPAVNSTIPKAPKDVVVGDEFKNLHKPCIALVDAPLFAGAHLIIGGCTHVIATQNASFSLPEVKRGLWPMQVMASLAPLMTSRQLLDYCMRGKPLSAEEAYDYGLVSDLVEDAEEMHDRADSICSDIKENSPAAIRLGLKAFQEMQNKEDKELHSFLYKMLQEVLQTEDAMEGLMAFREKRKPEWKGK